MTTRSPYDDTSLATRVDLPAIAAWNAANQQAIVRNRNRPSNEAKVDARRRGWVTREARAAKKESR